MKVAASPPQLSQENALLRRDADPEQGGADSFAALLAAMIGGASLDGQKPDITPAIGGHGTAFEQARLLVETAFDRTAASAASLIAVGDLPKAVSGVAGRAADILAAIQHLVSNLSLDSVQGEALSPPAVVAGQIAGPAAANLRDFRVPSAGLPHGTSAVGPAAPMAMQPQAGPIEPPGTSEAIDPAASPDLAPAPTGQHLPFGAQLLACEGGFQLLLRLPRLMDGERRELAANLARMFESFGVHPREIVIHELAEG